MFELFRRLPGSLSWILVEVFSDEETAQSMFKSMAASLPHGQSLKLVGDGKLVRGMVQMQHPGPDGPDDGGGGTAFRPRQAAGVA